MAQHVRRRLAAASLGGVPPIHPSSHERYVSAAPCVLPLLGRLSHNSPLLLCSLAVLRLLGKGEPLLQPPRRRLKGHRDAALEHPKVLGFVRRLNAAHAADAHSLLVGDGPY